MEDVDENDEDYTELVELINGAEVGICDEDWYIDFILDAAWDSIPERLRRPSNISEIKELIVKKVNETRDEFMKTAGLIEDDDDEEGIEYIININITDEVSGTVYSSSGGGPGYREVVENLENAAGSVIFYEHRDHKPDMEANYFDVTVKIYRNGEVIIESDVSKAFYKLALEILRDARYDMAKYK